MTVTAPSSGFAHGFQVACDLDTFELHFRNFRSAFVFRRVLIRIGPI